MCADGSEIPLDDESHVSKVRESLIDFVLEDPTAKLFFRFTFIVNDFSKSMHDLLDNWRIDIGTRKDLLLRIREFCPAIQDVFGLGMRVLEHDSLYDENEGFWYGQFVDESRLLETRMREFWHEVEALGDVYRVTPDRCEDDYTAYTPAEFREYLNKLLK